MVGFCAVLVTWPAFEPARPVCRDAGARARRAHHVNVEVESGYGRQNQRQCAPLTAAGRGRQRLPRGAEPAAGRSGASARYAAARQRRSFTATTGGTLLRFVAVELADPRPRGTGAIEIAVSWPAHSSTGVQSAHCTRPLQAVDQVSLAVHSALEPPVGWVLVDTRQQVRDQRVAIGLAPGRRDAGAGGVGFDGPENDAPEADPPDAFWSK